MFDSSAASQLSVLWHMGLAMVLGASMLTTAATILFVAAIGVGVALDQIFLSIGATLLVLITLRVVNVVERRLT
jgi:uncharacterized membrane protein YhiD involved in acid resistance